MWPSGCRKAGTTTRILSTRGVGATGFEREELRAGRVGRPAVVPPFAAGGESCGTHLLAQFLWREGPDVLFHVDRFERPAGSILDPVASLDAIARRSLRSHALPPRQHVGAERTPVVQREIVPCRGRARYERVDDKTASGREHRPRTGQQVGLRHVARWPVRAAATTLGISFGVALLVTALLSFDFVELMIDVAFFRTERQQATLNFTDEKHERALGVVQRMPGVLRAEPYRSVSVRLRNGHLERKLSIVGKPRTMDLSRVLDLDFKPVELPESGLVVGERVAEILQLRRGDVVEVEILEGRRGFRQVPVADVIKSYFGLAVFMDIDALATLVYDARLTGVHIAYDTRRQGDLFAAIKSTPGIGSIALQRHALVRFRETIAQNINYSVTIYVVLATIIAFGVVYNSARIQLSENAARAGEPARAGLHQGRGVARAAHRAGAPDAGGDSAGLGLRLRLRLAADPGLLERPLSRALRDRAGDLCQGEPRRAGGDGGLRADRASAHRQAGPHRSAEDPGLGATPCATLPQSK